MLSARARLPALLASLYNGIELIPKLMKVTLKNLCEAGGSFDCDEAVHDTIVTTPVFHMRSGPDVDSGMRH